MAKILILVLPFFLLSAGLRADEILNWRELPELPPLPGKSIQPGLAGAFAGVHNDALIIAGGANFPDGLPWLRLTDGSRPKKIYNKDIYVLQNKSTWIISDVKLPAGFSYGVSIPTGEGLICIGGERQEHMATGSVKSLSDKVFFLKHIGNGEIVIDTTRFPDLPEAVSAMSGTKIRDYIYIAGGNSGSTETNNFWRLNCKKNKKWEILKSWPGPPRSHHITIAQSDGVKDCLYLFSGRFKDTEQGWQFLKDSYKYDPVDNSWMKLADIGTNLSYNKSVCIMAASGIKLGANHIAIFGGASGDLFQKVEQDMPRQIRMLEKSGKDAEAANLTAEKWSIYEKHPGFSRDILVFHTITNSWTKIGQVPQSLVDGLTVGSHVTTTAVQWDGEIVIPSGEVRPGVRSPKIWMATPQIQNQFGLINYIVLIVYLAALIIMGFYFSKREKSTDDFFKAGGRVPWWAAGLSIFGTQLSAITFMAIPAKSFATDWTWIIMNMTIIAVAPFIIFLFLPFYRRLNVTTAYEYIEKRFNIVVRCTASAMFMVFQFARIGIVLYLPSIALSLVTGIDILICIAVMALLSIIYTVMGGIEAVIWTDVFQVLILMGGAVLAFFMMAADVQNGIGGIFDLSMQADKLHLVDFHFSLKSPTFWVLVFGGFGANLVSYGSDQTVIQRYLTTKDEKDAARSIWTNGILTIPASIIFFSLGTALFVFFKSFPQKLNPTMAMTDAVFPWYIVSQLPAGIAGLLIAGIFAAAMSSLDSSMNSVATAFTTDFYKRFKPQVKDQKCLKIARLVTMIVGICGMTFALAMATWEIKSLWEQFVKYIGLFGGGLGGLFFLAIFTKRATGKGAMIGLISSGIIQYFINISNSVHGIAFAATGMISCFVIGYLVSLFKSEKKDLSGLTLYTMKEKAIFK